MFNYDLSKSPVTLNKKDMKYKAKMVQNFSFDQVVGVTTKSSFGTISKKQINANKPM